MLEGRCANDGAQVAGGTPWLSGPTQVEAVPSVVWEKGRAWHGMAMERAVKKESGWAAGGGLRAEG